jgi:hypothetical protein
MATALPTRAKIETEAERLLKLSALDFYAWYAKVQSYFACYYEPSVSHEINWKRAISAIEAGWSLEKELQTPGLRAHCNLSGLAGQLRHKWRD